ncbi:MAG: hypothetical protein ABIZ80_12020 [Bryobacteraceae bacterium]
MVLNRPELARENLLPKDKAWESHSLALTGDMSKPISNFTARAIWRLDGFTSVDAPYAGGGFTTPLVNFRRVQA